MHRSAALFTEIDAFSVFMTLVVYGPRNCTAEAAVDFAEVVVVVRCHAACQEAAAAAADTLEASFRHCQ